MESYVQGNSLESTMVFRDADTGDPVDPDEVRFSTKEGQNPQTTYLWTADVPGTHIEKTATGTFRTVTFLDPYGSWSRAWQGILDGASTNYEVRFKVTQTQITPTAP